MSEIELPIDKMLTEDMFMKCHICAVKESCSVYDRENPRRVCPREPVVYQNCVKDLVVNKGVDPNLYSLQIHELAMLHVELFRRQLFVSIMGIQEAEIQGITDSKLKYSRLISKKEKELGTTRYSQKGHIKELGGKKGDFMSAFKNIEKVHQGKLELAEPRSIVEEAKKIKQASLIQVKQTNEITFAHMNFEKYGVDIEPHKPKKLELPKPKDYKRPVRK